MSKGPAGPGPVTAGEAIVLIEAVAGPSDLFGPDAVRCYRRLARLTHPDRLYGPRRFRPFAIPA